MLTMFEIAECKQFWMMLCHPVPKVFEKLKMLTILTMLIIMTFMTMLTMSDGPIEAV